MEDLSDAEVIAVSLRDPQSFGVLFDRHFCVICGYLARRLSAADADEVAGDVFRTAFERRATYDSGRSLALPWLYGEDITRPDANGVLDNPPVSVTLWDRQGDSLGTLTSWGQLQPVAIRVDG